MTVVSSGNTITFAGDGVQNLFDFNFRIFSTEDLCAVVRDSEGTEKKLVHGTDFKLVFGIGMDSGKVQYPVSGDPLSVGESITLYREISYTQELELVENDAFSVQLLNDAFDRGVMRDQQLQEQMDRALKYEISTSAEERLSPQELIKNISSARDEAVAAGDEAVSAENTVREMSAAAQLASEIAQSAQLGAEAARDAAVQVAAGDLAELRSPVPVLSGPVEAPEGTTVLIEISDHVDDGLTSYDVNVFGFGSAIISGSTISWKLGITEADTPKIMEVIRRSRGELQSDIATYELQVKYIPVQAGPTMAFADSEAGYPGATVDADGVHAPAHSVGADNTNQIVSGQPEVTQTSGNLHISNATTSSFDTAETIAINDDVIADTGTGKVASVSGGSTIRSSTTLEPNTTFDQLCEQGGFANIAVGADGWSERARLTSNVSPYDEGQRAKATELITATGDFFYAFHIRDWEPMYVHKAGYLFHFSTYQEDASLGGDVVQDIALYLCDIGGNITWKGFAAKYGDDYYTPTHILDVPTIDTTAETWVIYSKDGDQVTFGFKYGDKYNAPTSISDLDASSTFTATPLTHPLGRACLAGYSYANEDVMSEIRFVAYGPSSYDGFIKSVALAEALPSIPTVAFKKADVAMKVGVGVEGEYLGPKKILTLTGTPSTSSFDVEGAHADDIYIEGGFYNSIQVDGQLVAVASVSEVDNGDGTYTTTIIPETELLAVPESVSIPDRCILSPDSYSYALEGTDLKITGAEIALEDDPALKRLALAVSGADGLTFKSGKIYIKEKP